MNKYPNERMNKRQRARVKLIAKEYLRLVRNDPDEINTDEELFEIIAKRLWIDVRYVKQIIVNRS